MAVFTPPQPDEIPKKIKLRTRLIRTVSFWYNKTKIQTSKTWQTNSFIQKGLFLGMLPHQGAQEIISFVDAQNQQNGITNRPLGLVVSVVEPDELAGKGFIGVKTVTPLEWNEKGVQHRSISMRDFSAEVDLDGSIETLKAMKQCIEEGKSVFIHCKAGRARSAMFCAVYMSIYENKPGTNQKYTIEEAVALLKEKRPQVSVGLGKQETAAKIVDAFNKQEKDNEQEKDSKMSNQNTLSVEPMPRHGIYYQKTIRQSANSGMEHEGIVVSKDVIESISRLLLQQAQNQALKITEPESLLGHHISAKDLKERIHDAYENIKITAEQLKSPAMLDESIRAKSLEFILYNLKTLEDCAAKVQEKCSAGRLSRDHINDSQKKELKGFFSESKLNELREKLQLGEKQKLTMS